jgi:hypothetical protein
LGITNSNIHISTFWSKPANFLKKWVSSGFKDWLLGFLEEDLCSFKMPPCLYRKDASPTAEEMSK